MRPSPGTSLPRVDRPRSCLGRHLQECLWLLVLLTCVPPRAACPEQRPGGLPIGALVSCVLGASQGPLPVTGLEALGPLHLALRREPWRWVWAVPGLTAARPPRTANTSPRPVSGVERERKVSMRLHRGAPVNMSSSDLTGRQDTSRMSTSQVCAPWAGAAP